MLLIGLFGITALGNLWSILGFMAYNGGLDLTRTIGFTVYGFLCSSAALGYFMYKLFKKEGL
ncbi:MAG: hypothetical protein KAV87_59075 [Desulfobacteraceae bacterium]|nr:hypothetical protein [Desulfobacteraceae bacterium]